MSSAAGQMDLQTGNDLLALKDGVRTETAQETEYSFDMAADEYARWNGLTVDSRGDPWAAVEHDDAIISTLPAPGANSLFELGNLPECSFSGIIIKTEQWQLPQSSLRLLQSVCKPESERNIAALMEEVCFADTAEQRRLKVEVPLLSSDHADDCRKLAKRVRIFVTPELDADSLPAPADISGSSGLEFAEVDKDADKKLMERLAKEPLEIGRDSMAVLAQSLKADLTEEDTKDFFESIIAYRGLRPSGHVTPPISPELKPLPDYFLPCDEDLQVPEPSDSGSVSGEVRAAEAKIFEDDNSFWDSVAGQVLPSPDDFGDLDISGLIKDGKLAGPSPLFSPKPLPRDLKLDVPLFLLDMEVDSPTRVIEPKDLARARALVDESSSDTFIQQDAEFTELLQAHAMMAMRSAEQEKLEPLDAIARVPVPIMDFSLPAPEWGVDIWDPAAMFKWVRARANVNWQSPKWVANQLAEQRMVWTPLPHMGQTASRLLSEKIEAPSGYLQSILDEQLRPVMTSADCVSKHRRLLILELRDDDGDIKPLSAIADSITEQDLSVRRAKNPRGAGKASRPEVAPHRRENMLARRRNEEQHSRDIVMAGRKRTTYEIDPKLLRSLAAKSRTWNTQQSFPGSPGNLQDLGKFYTFESLAGDFPDIKVHKKPKLLGSPFFRGPEVDQPAGQACSVLQPASHSNQEITHPEPRPKLFAAVAPPINPPNTPLQVLISVRRKRITRELQHLIPGIEFVERNYDRFQSPTGLPDVLLSSMEDADITISPATGILLTTMVMLRQKPLPGDKGQLLFRNVVENVASRYERLVILVSEGNTHQETMNPLAHSDAKALADFQGLVAGLQTDVELLYVGGGTKTLVRWLAAVICKYAAEAYDTQHLLVPAETWWEVFLRRAGMNSYAAQVVLANLEHPRDAPGRAPFRGLPLFITMSRDERRVLLESSLGGRRVLDRVSDTIDKQWGPRMRRNEGEWRATAARQLAIGNADFIVR
ncbi:hypothetical protein QBC47DRAFT_439944 [Echria macrotheca]|uniref:Uncharacterized protein n=1 Tax=Echria macrotheca TaxID=438768 RepID=A0AAJ0B1A1_9PEZI|nr:hypothetical protein QBC47DRAFT_439944 [Echria macrotheca]